MTITVSKNLNRRLRLLSAEIKFLSVLRANKNWSKAETMRAIECQKQLAICKQLLRTELVNAPIERLLHSNVN